MQVVNVDELRETLHERSMTQGWGREAAEAAARNIQQALGLLYVAVDFGRAWEAEAEGASRWQVVKAPDIGDETVLLGIDGDCYFTGVVEFAMHESGLVRTSHGVWFKRRGRYGAAWIERERRGTLLLAGPRLSSHASLDCMLPQEYGGKDCNGVCNGGWHVPEY